jgi:hypothetical protein
MSRAAALEVVMLSAWLGAAILVAAVVAPAAFRVLPTRTLAGALVGQVLPVIFISGLMIAAAASLLEVRASDGTSHWMGKAALGLVIVACIIAQFVIGPKIEAVRVAIGGPVDALDASDPRRLQFGRLHAFSVLWMGVGMIGAGLAIVQKMTLRK